MTFEPARPASPFVSLFGAYRPDGGAPMPVVVDLYGPRALAGRARVLALPAAVSVEGVVEGCTAEAELELRLRGTECRVRFRDAGGAPWQIVLRGTTGASLRAKTELAGVLEGPGGACAGGVLLRLNWRALRLKR